MKSSRSNRPVIPLRKTMDKEIETKAIRHHSSAVLELKIEGAHGKNLKQKDTFSPRRPCSPFTPGGP